MTCIVNLPFSDAGDLLTVTLYVAAFTVPSQLADGVAWSRLNGGVLDNSTLLQPLATQFHAFHT